MLTTLTPVLDLFFDEHFDVVSDLLALLKEFLEGMLTTHRSKCGVGDFADGSIDGGNAIARFLGVDDTVIDNSVDVDCDVVLREDQLPLQVEDSTFPVGIHGAQTHWDDSVGTGVDIVQAGLQLHFKSSELLTESDIALGDLGVGVGTPTAAAGHPSSHASGAASAAVEHAFVASHFLLLVVVLVHGYHTLGHDN